MMWLLRLVALTLCCALPAISLAKDFDLAQAFKDEVALLELEKQKLKTQLQELQQESAQERNLKKSIEVFSAELVQVEVQNKSASDTLSNTKENTKSNNREALAQMVKRSADFLSKRNDGATESLEPTSIQSIFLQVIERIHQEGQLRVVSGEFYFNPEGKEITGDVVYLANVGALTLFDNTAAALLPIGDKGLRRTDAETTMSHGKGDVQLWPLHLFHAGQQFEHAPQQSGTLSQKLKKGGWLMWPILLLALLGLIVFLERSISLGQAFFKSQRFVKRLESDIEQGQWQQLEGRCQKTHTPLSATVLYIVKNAHAGRETLEDLVCQRLLKCRPQYTRFLNILQIIAVAAPLLGLLGTVTGMIQSFSAMQNFGASNPQLFSAGISEALLTTQFGLALAIPALLAHAVLSRSAERILDVFQYSCLLVLNSAPQHTAPNKSASNISLLESA